LGRSGSVGYCGERRIFEPPPNLAPIDPASLIFADADIASLLRAAGETSPTAFVYQFA